MRFELDVRSGKSERVLINIVNRAIQGQLSAILVRYGSQLLAYISSRMFIFLRDVNKQMRGYPIYSGTYMAEKFGGLFTNPKAAMEFEDLTQIPPYGAMADKGRKISPAKRQEAISRGMYLSRAHLSIKRQYGGIGKTYLMIRYTIPHYNMLDVKYAERIEATGWKGTARYNVRGVLIGLKHFTFNTTLLRRELKLLLERK